ncbi:SDR family oxidoreductase [Telluria mixta]|uniref:SDR family oxidoreductase n=1 Tax=Telluria mixta TaxID=34071 RepID=A0ABT2C604_9BURK|nr:SDR family oxidoreductase [Telluria mixta]MCS0632827.1 SDR family oxidoreductase [Telluria mixta]WEM97901.1 SDR family oxidoreductase [Telluria mixta]
MRILLTGASGFIGKHLLHALLAEGHDVVCAVRHPERLPAHPHLSAIRADFANDTDKSTWLARLSGVEAVINTVGIFRERGTQTFENLHTRTPRALFAACAESDDVHMVVQLSALGADEQADTAYHLSKKAADDYLATLPIRAAIVQPSLVYGADGASARVFKAMASLPFAVRLGDSPQLVQPIHVDDVVAAIVTLLRQRLHADRAESGPVRRIALVGPQARPFVDYLATLRRAMGMGRLRVLPLPGGVAKLLARIGAWLPGALLDPDALRMLDRGNAADPGPTLRLLGRPPRDIASFVVDPGAERARAKLDWLLPVLRLAIAIVWIATAIVSAFLYPAAASYELLARSGIPEQLRPVMLYGASVFDLVLGFATLFLHRRRWLWLMQLALIGFYSVVIAVRLPEFLIHPYGPLTKNLPMLAAIWLLYELEKEET